MRKDDILKALKDKNPKLCVLATVSLDNKPESAVVGYVIKDDFTILVSTHPKTRKWKNLEKNPHVSLVMGFSFTEMNIQIEGKAKLITQEDVLQETADFFFTQNPDAAKFRSPDTVFIAITPTWVRTIDLPTMPPKEEEITL